MITLKGQDVEFFCASGAMAFNGDGWWFEWPWRVLGLLRPEEFVVITKTLTYYPKTGNLKHWCPWRCIKLIKGGGTVNSVGLTNPGFQWWVRECYEHLTFGRKIVLSIAPENHQECEAMLVETNRLWKLMAIELNLSCPNVQHIDEVDYICSMVERFVKYSCHLIILKLGIHQKWLEICKALDDKVIFDVVNAVPWHMVYPMEQSPLTKYGLTGAVSGSPIRQHARDALITLRKVTKSPIISGGSIDSLEEVKKRFHYGADAVAFGSIFIRKPWLPNRIMNQYHKGE